MINIKQPSEDSNESMDKLRREKGLWSKTAKKNINLGGVII